MKPLPPLAPDVHKGEAGRVLCVVGSSTMPGAAILVARAVQRAGAGLCVVVDLDAELRRLLPVVAPEAVLANATESGDVDWRFRDPHALVFGPGLGDDSRARRLLASFLEAGSTYPSVLDADALNALDGEPERLRSAAGPLVLTPHPGEASRLLSRIVPHDPDGRREAALELARRADAVVCLKGRGTVVTDGEAIHVNGTGNEGMATAGSGDVLAGILGAYLAAANRSAGSFTPFDAARLAVHVHGLAGDLAAERVGKRALCASDLVAELPAAQRRLAPDST